MSKDRFLDLDALEGSVAKSKGCEHVIIPAKDVAHKQEDNANGIGHTLAYLARLGFTPDRIHVIINGCKDNTEEEARSSGLATVHKQDEILDAHQDVIAKIEHEFGVKRDDLHGKGVAMFAGMLALRKLGLHDDAPVIFLDADIRGIHSPNPVGCLLAGWYEWAGDVKMVKLASKDRGNEAIHAFVGNTRNLHGIGALEWPLCGQVLMPWGALKQLRLATGYCVEVAMLAGLWLEHRGGTIFGEVVIPAEIIDKPNTDQTVVQMYGPIMYLLGLIDTYGDLRGLSSDQLKSFRASPSRFFVPRDPDEEGAPQLEDMGRNGLLPAIDELD